MSFTYDPTDLTTATAAGRLNVVRLLVGDTVEAEEKKSNEEIIFYLSEASDNAYLAASYVAYAIAAYFAQLVNAEVDGQLSEDLSDLFGHYNKLSAQLKQQAANISGVGMSIKAGGISKNKINQGRYETDRVRPPIYLGQFEGKYSPYQPYPEDDC